MPQAVIFSRSADYPAIHKLLADPKSLLRMTGSARLPENFTVGPLPNIEYVLGQESGKPVAVFVIVRGVEVHFAFDSACWGRTLDISKRFLEWAWENLRALYLIGPIPSRNRLALRLAKRAGFKESHYTDRGDLIYLYMERPAA